MLPYFLLAPFASIGENPALTYSSSSPVEREKGTNAKLRGMLKFAFGRSSSYKHVIKRDLLHE
jgi:hypothetical protein